MRHLAKTSRSTLDRLARCSSWHALLCALGLAAVSSARADDDGLLHYDPPAVDYVYPTEGDILAPATSAPAASAPDGKSSPTEAPAATPAETPAGLAEPSPEADDPVYGARAKVRVPATPGSRRISLESARDLPGAFGDPLRILDALPGAVPVGNAVPYVYLRGAPPATVGYVYDEIPLPQLFHGAIGPAVIHPRATGPVTLQAGVPSARYGRRAGGLVLAEGVEPQRKFDAEVELRAIDAGAWLEVPVGDGTLTVSGRIGYPHLVFQTMQSLGVLEKGSSFNYWDGQLRYQTPIGRRDRLELVWLGSFDSANFPGFSNNPRAGASKIEFHRVETRYIRTFARGEMGSALRFSYDNSALGDALAVRAFTVGPRFWTKHRFGQHSLRIGGDLYSSKGNVVDGPGTLASPQGDLLITLPSFGEASARNQGGLYAETVLATSERTRLELGARFDYWSAQGNIDLAFDPRGRFTYRPTESLTLHTAVGMAHQPAVFLLPLPGLSEIAVDRGLSRALQAEAGVGYELPAALSLDVQGYFHKYDGLLLPELVVDGAVPEDPPRSKAVSYGVEVFLKRADTERLNGWISYTLGFAEADSGPDWIGKFKPDFDVRHVLNAVLQWRVWRGLSIGGRFSARSGRLVEQLNPRYAQRLPWFLRVDARIGYAWKGRFADMLAYFEWLNVTGEKEYLDADCLLGTCRATEGPLLSIPNVGVRADF